MKTYLLLARSEPAGGNAQPGALPEWFHIVPGAGEYPIQVHKKDKKVEGRLVLDSQGFSNLLADFRARASDPAFAGLLVDREHLSEQPEGDTEAAAWVKDLELRDDGIWSKWQLTSLGKQLLADGVYKFRSPVISLESIGGDRYRPRALKSVGLTNRPHFTQLAASLHRESGQPQEAEMPVLEALVARLKLAADATEAAALEAVDALIAKAAAAESAAGELATVKARVSELETAALQKDAEEFVGKHKARFADGDKLKALFVADRSAAEQLVALLKPEGTPPTLTLNRADGQPPAGSPGAVSAPAAERAAAQQVAVNEVRSRPRYAAASYSTCWAVAATEKPELFVNL